MLTTVQKDEVTAYVNQYRAKNQAPPMKWDETIYAFTQNWANSMLVTKRFQHSGSSKYGENIAYFQGYGTDAVTLLKKSIDSWYSEISSYDFNNPGFTSATGHFTCLVWVASTNFALGISMDLNTNEAYISMNTSPPGNVIGQFDKNVLSSITPGPLPTPTPTPTPPPPPPPAIPDLNHKNIIFKMLFDIVYAINANKPKSVIINIINQIITTINGFPNF